MELDLNIDSNGNVIVNTLSEYVAYISQLQAMPVFITIEQPKLIRNIRV